MNDLEIFVITNGRSTLPYVIRSLESQSTKRPVTVIRDMQWIDALYKCVNLSESSFYIRVDDDMFLHRDAVAYYLHILNGNDVGVYECKLWEDWTNKAAGSLKAYNTKVVRKIGFRTNRLGKVDKVFTQDLKKTKYKRIKDNSMVGLHACSSVEDQKRYRQLWRETASISKSAFAKTFDNIIHPPQKVVADQFSDLRKIRQVNKKKRTKFFYFIKRRS